MSMLLIVPHALLPAPLLRPQPRPRLACMRMRDEPITHTEWMTQQAEAALHDLASNPVVVAELMAKCDAGEDSACDVLIKLDKAKKAWLTEADAPTWSDTAAALNEVVAEASQMADLTEKCESGEKVACDTLSLEDEAKKAWLAKLNVPAWGAAAQVASNIATMASTKLSEEHMELYASTWDDTSKAFANLASEMRRVMSPTQEAFQLFVDNLTQLGDDDLANRLRDAARPSLLDYRTTTGLGLTSSQPSMPSFWMPQRLMDTGRSPEVEDLPAQLRELAQLKVDGVLDEEEFKQAKTMLLSRDEL